MKWYKPQKQVAAMSTDKYTIVGLGEVLWDLLCAFGKAA
jgi:hypothetical protein